MHAYPNPVSELLDAQLQAVLDHYGLQGDDISFVLIPDVKGGASSSWDDIVCFWQTPCISGFGLSREKCLAFLAAYNNTAPLWINAYLIDGSLILEYCQRFRKQSAIRDANPDNPLAPFRIKSAEEFDRNRLNERKSLIRASFFSGAIDTSMAEKLGNRITEKEFTEFLDNHFADYGFYPPLYNHSKPGDRNYSAIVLAKIPASEGFRIFKNEAGEETVFGNMTLREAGRYYLENELGWKIGPVCIEQN